MPDFLGRILGEDDMINDGIYDTRFPVDFLLTICGVKKHGQKQKAVKVFLLVNLYFKLSRGAIP